MADYKRSSTVEHSLSLTGAEFFRLLDTGAIDNGDQHVEDLELPDLDELDIRVLIPSGGDYSGMSLPLKEMNLYIEWKEESEE